MPDVKCNNSIDESVSSECFLPSADSASQRAKTFQRADHLDGRYFQTAICESINRRATCFEVFFV
jgi:hypothetical protein